ncbi:Cell division control protein 48 [Cucumispora dikerogammari]|nr:Cell division control protein 48 [Cucumispora dikerogammari]
MSLNKHNPNKHKSNSKSGTKSNSQNKINKTESSNKDLLNKSHNKVLKNDTKTDLLQSALLSDTTPNTFITYSNHTDFPQPSLAQHTLQVNSSSLDALQLSEGDYVRVLGKRRKECLFSVELNEDLPNRSVLLNRISRYNLGIKSRETVKLYQVDKLTIAENVQLQYIVDKPITTSTNDNNEDMSEDEKQNYLNNLIKYFSEELIPVSLNTIISINEGFIKYDFKIIGITDKKGPVKHATVVIDETRSDATIITPDSILLRSELNNELKSIGYDDIGGARRQLNLIRETVELPLRHPALFEKLGVKPPKGVLLYGPPGTGKTLIARAIANECDATFYTINGPEVMSKMQGESEANLRKIFEEAEKTMPSIIFIDEIDSLAPKREKGVGEAEKRLVAQLLTLMDGLKARSNIIILGATNRVNSLDPALRRFGRFDRELEIGIPDEIERLDILSIHTKNMKLAEDIDLMAISKEIHGYVGSDIAALCSEAALQTIRKRLHEIDLDEPLDNKFLNSLEVNDEDFKYAISNTDPSSLREAALQTPNVKWEDIGGYENTKNELKETIQYPILYPDYFLKFGLQPSRGILFYGPPGCGKTLLAKAVASMCGANFISVKGPELMTKWVGESESNIREVFAKARGAAPCVVFFDEIDSIGSSRNNSTTTSGVNANMLNSMLAEMDGMNAKKNVFVIGATNRPDQLDTALLRPGRLDQLIYIPLPDYEARLEILRAALRKSPLSPSVCLEAISRNCTGFSGADLTEICQRACKFAIKEAIAARAQQDAHSADKLADLQNETADEELESLEPRHFDAALKTARRSVSEQELQTYEAFARQQKVSINVGLAGDEENKEEEDGLYD